MNLENKTDEELTSLLTEARRDRKRLQELERKIHNEFNKRNRLPELPPLSFRKERLTAQQKVDFAHFLKYRTRSYGEIIDFIDEQLGK